MASGGVPPWDGENHEEKGPVSASPRYRDLLEANKDVVTRLVTANPEFWTQLRQLAVVNRALDRKMLPLKTQQDRLAFLLGSIEKGPMWKLHGFFRVLYLTDQAHVLTTLGLNPQLYGDNRDSIASNESNEGVPVEVLTLGEEYVEAYRRGCQGGTKAICQTRVMLVGHFAAGKTNLKRCLLKEKFIPEHHSTDSIEADPSDSKVDITKTKGWQLHTAKNEYEEMIAAYMIERVNEQVQKIGPEGDKTSNRTQVASESEVGDSNATCTGGKEYSFRPGSVGGLQCYPGWIDKPEEVSNEKNGIGAGEIPATIVQAVKRAMQGEQTSSNLLVELFFWDFGGQGVFYNTHKTFLTRRSIYVVVLDLTKHLDHCLPTWRKNRHGELVLDTSCPQTVGEYLDYWCSCIHTFVPEEQHTGPGASTEPAAKRSAPTIVIVCTHKDECTPEDAKDYVRKVYKFVENKPYAAHIHNEIFTISNKVRDESDVNKLQERMVSLASEQVYRLPLTWVQFKEQLMVDSAGKIPRKTWKDASDVGRNVGMDGYDVAAALKFFHEVGDLVFFDEPTLRDFIITKPQWLIQEFRKVITVPTFHSAQFRDSARHWRNLDEAGLLHEAVLQHVWTEDTRQELVKLMKKFALLVPITSAELVNYALCDEDDIEDTQSMYIIPCLLPQYDEGQETRDEAHDDGMVHPIILIPPQKFLPMGLTSRLIAGLINEDGWQLAGKLYKDFATFLTKGEDDSAIKVCIKGRVDEIEIHGKELLGAQVCGDFADSLKVVLERLDAIVSSVCPQQSFKVGIHCPECRRRRLRAVVSIGYRGERRKKFMFCKRHGDRFDTSMYALWFSDPMPQATANAVRGCVTPPAIPENLTSPVQETGMPTEIATGPMMPNLDPGLRWMFDDFKTLRDQLRGRATKGVIIAILDSGIYSNHPDLEGMVICSRNFAYVSEAEEKRERRDLVIDSLNHGTMSAGILKQYAGENVKILNLKVIPSHGGGTLWFVSEALTSIEQWDQENPDKKVDIILMSVGAQTFDNQVSRHLSRFGESKVIISSAANEGNRKSETIHFPARHGSVIAIGSCDKDGNRCGHSSVGSELSFLFPGLNIKSTSSQYLPGTRSRYSIDSGTSFAAPHCAALVALMLTFIEGYFGANRRAFLTSSYHMRNLLKETCGRTYTAQDGYGMPNIKRINETLISTYLKEHASFR